MTNGQYGNHFSVLNKEVVDYLGGNFLSDDQELLFADLTFGGGGHTMGLLSRFKHARVVAVDQDIEAIQSGIKRLDELGFSNRYCFIHCNFSEINRWFTPLHRRLDGVIMDLGVSSHHFDCAERGFSFREEGPLDMRMNQSAQIPTAADLVNEMPEGALADLLYQYGEERLSRRIARAIVESRAKNRINTTKELEDIIFHSYPANQRHGRTHPATRSFQALRIAVNGELSSLEGLLDCLPTMLNPRARVAIISFHSLEDRIVKHRFKAFQEKEMGEALSKKPILPSEIELEQNSRSRSAKLRVFQIK